MFRISSESYGGRTYYMAEQKAGDMWLYVTNTTADDIEECERLLRESLSGENKRVVKELDIFPAGDIADTRIDEIMGDSDE